MRIAHLTLAAPRDGLDALVAFYGETLGLPVLRDAERVDVEVGPDTLSFEPADGEPFFHFALLIPRERFAAAHAWLGDRAELLAGKDGETTFDFSFWDALACYCHDPAGSIVELIGHPEVAASADGPFSAREIVGISEIGIVSADPGAAAAELEASLGLPLWSGELPALGFVGRKAHTLILSPEGRGWLPTGRPAEPHPLTAELDGVEPGEIAIGTQVVRGLRP